VLPVTSIPIFGFFALSIAAAALGVTFWVLRRPRIDRQGRGLESAAVVAVGPLVASYSWGTHLVLLLLPMLVLIAWAVRRRDWMVIGLVAAGWLLTGPGHNAFQTLLAAGYSNVVVLRLMAEGASSREIATRLGISYATVRSHIRSMGAKLGVHSKVEAVVKGRKLAIIA